MKVVQVHETPKQLSNPTPTPKIVRWGPKRKNGAKTKSKSNVRIQENIENESCSTTCVDTKTVIEPYSDHKTSP